MNCLDNTLEIIDAEGAFALDNCPFCGCEEVKYVKYQHAAGERFAVTCFGCLATIDPGWAQSKSAVQAMWNTRRGEYEQAK